MSNEHYLNNNSFEAIISEFQNFKKQKSRHEMILADIKETYDRRVKVHGDETRLSLLDEQKAQYQATCNNYNQCQEKLARAFYLLAENITNYYRFSGIDMDDAIQEGVLICFEKVDRFNPNYKGKYGQKAKAFNYMTTCIINHFRQIYRSIRNYNELKKKYHDHLQNKQDKFERSLPGHRKNVANSQFQDYNAV
jgi:DNA-directed RNA polymerase specialized sigma subunit